MALPPQSVRRGTPPVGCRPATPTRCRRCRGSPATGRWRSAAAPSSSPSPPGRRWSITVLNGQRDRRSRAATPSITETVGFFGRGQLLAASATRLPLRPARLLLPGQRRTAARRARRSTSSSPSAGPPLTALIPSYQEEPRRDPDDAAVGRAAGVPRHARRAADRRPAEPALRRRRAGCSTAPRRCPPRSSACSSEPRARFDRAARPLRGRRRPGNGSRRGDEVLTRWPPSTNTPPAGSRSLTSIPGRRPQRAFFTTHVLGSSAADLALIGARPARRRRRRAGEAAARPRSRSSTAASPGPSAPRSTSFERKRYASLSHEPNKAMNLNSYIGLMGGRYREVETPVGRVARPRRRRRARPRRARPRLRADARRRQRDPARVLPAAGAT